MIHRFGEIFPEDVYGIEKWLSKLLKRSKTSRKELQYSKIFVIYCPVCFGGVELLLLL